MPDDDADTASVASDLPLSAWPTAAKKQKVAAAAAAAPTRGVIRRFALAPTPGEQTNAMEIDAAVNDGYLAGWDVINEVYVHD